MLWTSTLSSPNRKGLGKGRTEQGGGCLAVPAGGSCFLVALLEQLQHPGLWKKWLPGWENSGAQRSLLKIPASSCVEAAAVPSSMCDAFEVWC